MSAAAWRYFLWRPREDDTPPNEPAAFARRGRWGERPPSKEAGTTTTTTAAHDDDIVPSDMTMDDDAFKASLDTLLAAGGGGAEGKLPSSSYSYSLRRRSRQPRPRPRCRGIRGQDRTSRQGGWSSSRPCPRCPRKEEGTEGWEKDLTASRTTFLVDLHTTRLARSALSH